VSIVLKAKQPQHISQGVPVAENHKRLVHRRDHCLMGVKTPKECKVITPLPHIFFRGSFGYVQVGTVERVGARADILVRIRAGWHSHQGHGVTHQPGTSPQTRPHCANAHTWQGPQSPQHSHPKSLSQPGKGRKQSQNQMDWQIPTGTM
jgi:hypothetical protein